VSEQVNISWQDIKALCPSLKTILKGVGVVLLLDLLLSVLLSFVLSDGFYFKKHFTPERYEALMSQYANNEYYIQPDTEAGWVNAPNWVEEGGNKFTDALGARTTREQVGRDVSVEALSNKDNLVFLLGSSVIDGYTLPYQQTLAGLLGDDGFETFNFGAYLYSIDQSYAFYQSKLARYQPKVLVVGIHNDADTIANMFAGFRETGAADVPFLKPAYRMVDHQLVKALPPYKAQFNHDINSLLAALEEGDAHYATFEYFQRLSLLPFSDLLRTVIQKMSGRFYDVDAYTEAVELQKKIMHEIVLEANKNGVEVVFVKLAGLFDLQHSLPNRLFYQFLHQDKNKLHDALLKDSPFNIVYVSDLLEATGEPLSDFYFDDQLHL